MILRNLELSDVKFMTSVWGQEKRIEGYGIPTDEETMRSLIHEWDKKLVHGRYYELFAIDVEGIMVGLLNFFEITDNSILIGISIDNLHWRKGYAYEAMQKAFDYLKDKGLYHVVSNCRADNVASIALHKKCGFQFLCEDISKRSGKRIYQYEKYLER